MTANTNMDEGKADPRERQEPVNPVEQGLKQELPGLGGWQMVDQDPVLYKDQNSRGLSFAMGFIRPGQSPLGKLVSVYQKPDSGDFVIVSKSSNNPQDIRIFEITNEWYGDPEPDMTDFISRVVEMADGSGMHRNIKEFGDYGKTPSQMETVETAGAIWDSMKAVATKLFGGNSGDKPGFGPIGEAQASGVNAAGFATNVHSEIMGPIKTTSITSAGEAGKAQGATGAGAGNKAVPPPAAGTTGAATPLPTGGAQQSGFWSTAAKGMGKSIGKQFGSALKTAERGGRGNVSGSAAVMSGYGQAAKTEQKGTSQASSDAMKYRMHQEKIGSTEKIASERIKAQRYGVGKKAETDLARTYMQNQGRARSTKIAGQYGALKNAIMVQNVRIGQSTADKLMDVKKSPPPGGPGGGGSNPPSGAVSPLAPRTSTGTSQSGFFNVSIGGGAKSTGTGQQTLGGYGKKPAKTGGKRSSGAINQGMPRTRPGGIK